MLQGVEQRAIVEVAGTLKWEGVWMARQDKRSSSSLSRCDEDQPQAAWRGEPYFAVRARHCYCTRKLLINSRAFNHSPTMRAQLLSHKNAAEECCYEISKNCRQSEHQSLPFDVPRSNHRSQSCRHRFVLSVGEGEKEEMERSSSHVQIGR
jgi:hypothetical protein